MRSGPTFNNVNISGGELTFVAGNINNGPPLQGFNLLLALCSPGALLNSRERYDPPRCAEETRTAILDTFLGWVESHVGASNSSMAWLRGPAGGGKSAIAQTLGELCQEKGLLAASFFFSRTGSIERSDAERFIPTIVSEIMRLFPELKPHVIAAVNCDPFLFSKSLRYQLEELLVKPLRAISPSQSGEVAPRLVIIDGLDECSDQEAQISLVEAIADAISRLPRPVCFFVASRPESHIVDAFERDPLKTTTALKLNLSDDPSAAMDIKLFLEVGFQEIQLNHRHRRLLPSAWPPSNTIDLLLERSTGQFIYPSTAMKHIRNPKYLPHRRLQDILDLSTKCKDHPFTILDSLYTFIFSRVEGEDVKTISRFFSLLLVIQSQNSDGSLRPAIGKLEEFLVLEPGELVLALDPFLSLLSLPDDPAKDLKIYHASLFDFLSDSNRSISIREHGINIDVSLGREIAALHWWEKIRVNFADADFLGHLLFISHCSNAPRFSETVKQCLFTYKPPNPRATCRTLTQIDLLYLWKAAWDLLVSILDREELGAERFSLHECYINTILEYMKPPALKSDMLVPTFNNAMTQSRHRFCQGFLRVFGLTFKEPFRGTAWLTGGFTGLKHVIVVLTAERRLENLLNLKSLCRWTFPMDPTSLNTNDELDSAVFEAVRLFLQKTPEESEDEMHLMSRECWGFDKDLTHTGFEDVESWKAKLVRWEEIQDSARPQAGEQETDEE
ncbi:hypothetical protein CPB83DRAFT_865421 [Crepidotus variabilis]|uniref:Nephrocystin 3-like N-terminal domain-containing protein n=1 Tax=Crepidotus variabilis TaxID=179855 RepID=A0A9P6E2Y4_9AGAR|nr:hypothetical protein CPB83DRAFT_865421 [Crepidotus variabilis]